MSFLPPGLRAREVLLYWALQAQPCYNAATMLSIKNLSKTFGDFQAVFNLNLDVKPGEIVALVGPNGSGKSTTVKIVTGLLQPTAGEVTVAGHDIVKQPLAAKAALGYVPDDPNVWSGMTGEEFLHFTGALYGMEADERQKKMKPLLKEFELGDIAQTYFEDYSRGNKQKFTIIAALMHEPQLLIIDEPIVGLDPASVETAKRLFTEFAEKGGSVLLVTHTLPVAEELANRVGVLFYSKLVGFGTLSELRHGRHLPASASLGDIYAAYTAKK